MLGNTMADDSRETDSTSIDSAINELAERKNGKLGFLDEFLKNFKKEFRNFNSKVRKPEMKYLRIFDHFIGQIILWLV